MWLLLFLVHRFLSLWWRRCYVKRSVGSYERHAVTSQKTTIFTVTAVKTWNLTNSVAFSQQENYTDWTTATGRRMSVPVDRGVSRGQRGGSPTAVNLSFLDRSRYFFFQIAPHLSSQGWMDPVPDPLLLRKSGSARNRTRDLWVCSQGLGTLNHRGGR
jgi:hypothetical protein